MRPGRHGGLGHVAPHLDRRVEARLDLTVEMYGAGRLALAAALAGEVDYATCAETPIVGAVVREQEPAVVATICRINNMNAVIGRADRGIASVADLRGKRIAVLRGTNADYFLHILLVTSGVDPHSVSVVPKNAETLIEAVVSGEVDGASVFMPYTVELTDALGANAVVIEEPGLYVTNWSIASSRSCASRNTDTSARLLRALHRANEFIAANPAEAQRITAERTGLRAEVIEEQWGDHHWAVGLDQALVLTMEDQARWLLGDDADLPDFLRYIDASAAERVRSESVRLVIPER
jgi:NitT/TauT family transport system substrate-binding protein